MALRGQTVVVTEASTALGTALALSFADQGANVLVNSPSFSAGGVPAVVDGVRKRGGKAVASVFPAADGASIIQAALDAFHGVAILVNNSEISITNKVEEAASEEQYVALLDFLKANFSSSRAVWAHFREQGKGKVINIANLSGVHGTPFKAHETAAAMGLVALTRSLGKDGERHGVKANAIVSSTDIRNGDQKDTNLIVSLVAALSDPNGPAYNEKVLEVGAGRISELRWERTKGVIFRPGTSYTPAAVNHRWSTITDFTNADHPLKLPDVDLEAILDAEKLPDNVQRDPVTFHGQTVVVTAAGAGLGRAYALMFGRLGANVVVHDITADATKVADEIVAAGGKAVGVTCPTDHGETIINTALTAFGSLHALVANERVMQTVSVGKMTQEGWDHVLGVNLRGSFKCVKAAWPIFQKQKYGRIVTACSANGIYGSPTAASYSTAKAAVFGFTRTAAIEGRPYNILVNGIAPSMGPITDKSSKQILGLMKSEYYAPVVGFLTSKENKDTSGGVFENFGTWASQTRWERSEGVTFPGAATREEITSRLGKITDFLDGRAESIGNVALEALRGTDVDSRL